jgi:glycosyltransferase involved in cell wall biosynthesis
MFSRRKKLDNKFQVCVVVYNCVWYDPRVSRQLNTYLNNNIDTYVVGVTDLRYDKSQVDKLKVPKYLVEIDKKYYRKNRTIFTKIIREYKIFTKVLKALKISNADMIHANDLNALIPSYFASRKLKCRLVYDSHELFPENDAYINRPLARWLLTKIESYLIKRCDMVISVSNAAAEYFQKKYKIEKPCVITNSALKIDKSQLKSAKSDKFEVLNHGQFYAGRGYDIMARSGKYLSEYPDIELVIRGFGPMEEELKKIASENSPSNFRIDPKVTVTELIPMASLSRVGVAITEPICENFKYSVSNKIFEYAAAGLPVIMSDIPEHRYLNEKYDFGIILKENTPECFSEAVITLYNDPELMKKYSRNAFKMSDELNWETEFEKLIKKIKQWNSKK